LGTFVIIVAAGRGTRARSGAQVLTDQTQSDMAQVDQAQADQAQPVREVPKQYAKIQGRSVLGHSIRAFEGHPAIDGIQVVIHGEDRASYDDVVCEQRAKKLLPPITGGTTRQRSVLAGLTQLAETQAVSTVLIHDAARPFVTDCVISRVLAALKDKPAVLAAIPLTDTLQRTDDRGTISETLARDGLWRAQTPQGFDFKTVLQAHRRALDAGRDDFTDDATLVRWAGCEVVVVPGSERNRKLTTDEDLAMCLDDRKRNPLRPRIGTGFDVHRCCPGDHVWLCGISIPATFALSGHSDADVALHALTDAILGALGDGDIGSHFPPSDPAWKGAPSRLFLADAATRVRKAGGEIGNVDITLMCETPKILPHRAQMCAQVASILGVTVDLVSVKATTTEGLGFTGRSEGIAAMASATIFVP